MALTKEDLQQITDIFQLGLNPIHQRLEKIDERLDKMDDRFDKIDERFDRNERASKLAGARRETQRKADKEEMKEFTLGAVKKLKAKFIQN